LYILVAGALIAFTTLSEAYREKRYKKNRFEESIEMKLEFLMRLNAGNPAHY